MKIIDGGVTSAKGFEAASAAAGAAMVTSALALFGISTYKRKH